MSQFKFGNGQVCRDLVTGFQGTVTGRADYLTGCRQYVLTPKVKDGGDWVEGRWFDENRLELVRQAPQATIHTRETKGGPQHNPPGKS